MLIAHDHRSRMNTGSWGIFATETLPLLQILQQRVVATAEDGPPHGARRLRIPARGYPPKCILWYNTMAWVGCIQRRFNGWLLVSQALGKSPS